MTLQGTDVTQPHSTHHEDMPQTAGETPFDGEAQAEETPEQTPTAPMRVWRIEVWAADGHDDPLGRNVLHESRELRLAENLSAVRTARVYLIESAVDGSTIHRIAAELLTDPVNQRYIVGSQSAGDTAEQRTVEVHYLPGVMDPVAQSTRDAIIEMLGSDPSSSIEVRTGFRYDLSGVMEAEARTIAERLLANGVIQSIHYAAYEPDAFPHTRPAEFAIRHVPIRDLDDEGLKRLSREGHLFLSLTEMKAIQDHYRALDREPRDIELETLAQTWSEHCVHKTLKSTVRYRQEDAAPASPGPSDWTDRPGHHLDEQGNLIVENVLKSTIAAATRRLIDEGADWCVSVFVDNAGVIRFDDEYCVTFKVETHNRPSAIEPYGGAATGIGGCIRDTMGTGLAAKPIANTDIFCVADPNLRFEQLPKGVLHPRRILKQVVAGVRDYGNRMGIPTVNGAVYFDDRYIGNPLVFAGSVGLIPSDKCFGDAKPGDRIIVMGGRTGLDGIHGATFSSAELTDTHAQEFSHAVQIGNAITEKTLLDVILQARDHESGCLYHAITDCGAGGLSSAVGEMGSEIGAAVQLDQAPLKYDGLTYTEIWISEAQERMVLAVPQEKVDTLLALARAEGVEACDLGQFGTENNQLILNYRETEVARLDMHFVHEGIPMPTRDAIWPGTPRGQAQAPSVTRTRTASDQIGDLLHALLAHPNIASKHWVIRQYDHEVQAGSVVKPLVGVKLDGPSDGAVLRPRLDSERGISLTCGLATAFGDADPYWMTLAAIDEAVRNAVCVGARPDRIAILDNFCWANCDKPHNMGALIRAAEACYDGAMAYRTPFISGKDSLNNEFKQDDGTAIAIPPTLLISAIGIVDDVKRCLTMDAKSAGNLLLIVGLTDDVLVGSHYHLVTGTAGPKAGQVPPRVDLAQAPHVLTAVARVIAEGHARSAHDCSEGGFLVAAAEMAFAGGLGLDIDLGAMPTTGDLDRRAACFAETPTRILLEVPPDRFDAAARRLRDAGAPFGQVGRFDVSSRLRVRSPRAGQLADLDLGELKNAWMRPLDW